MTSAVTDSVYNKVFNDSERTFKLEGLTETWQKRAYKSVSLEIYDISGNHIETIKFRNVLTPLDASIVSELEHILTKAANNLKTYASIKKELIDAVMSQAFTCAETEVEEVSHPSSTPIESAIPSQAVFSKPRSWNREPGDKRAFKIDRNDGTSRKPELDISYYKMEEYGFKVKPRNIALYQAQLVLTDSQHSVNDEALKATARTAAMQEAEDKERQRKTNMLMLMGMFG